MKKIVLWALLALPVLIAAQPSLPVPADPAVRIGTLKNGMRYYIRHNEAAKGLAHFEIFHNVGSLQEEDSQDGLAHFLEHMAFNGLQHLPGKQMTSYMESIGVKWGFNLNAMTAPEFTRYIIKDVPLTRPGIVDTCLLVLYDWSGGIEATPAAIDNERAVIQEEFRSQGGVSHRVRTAISPTVFNGSKHAFRSVIGDMEVVRNFSRDQLMEFYNKWYKPEMQAVAIVGDFDAAEMERKVVALFSQLPRSKKPLKRQQFNVADNKGLMFVSYSDPEVVASRFEFLFKHPAVSFGDRAQSRYFEQRMERNIVIQMMNARVEEALAQGEFPLRGMTFGYNKFAGDRDVFSLAGGVRVGAANIRPAIDMALQQAERIRQHGFSQGELDRIKAQWRNQFDNRVLESDRRTNANYVDDWFENFTANDPFPDRETHRDIVYKALDALTLARVNATMRGFFERDNVVATLVTPESEAADLPDAAWMTAQLVRDRMVEPFVEPTLRTSIMRTEPTPGRVVSERSVALGATEWVLSNGVKVYLLPTANSENDISMVAFANGGSSVQPDERFSSARMVESTVAESGVDDLTAMQLHKMMAGKQAFVAPFYAEYEHGFNVATTPADLETALQMLNLYITAPRFDPAALDRNVVMLRESLATRGRIAMSQIQDSVVMWRVNKHPRARMQLASEEELQQVSLPEIEQIYRTSFTNPRAFTYIMTGALDLVAVEPLVEKYLGGIEGVAVASDWRDVGKRAPQGRVVIDFARPTEQPMAMLFEERTAVAKEFTPREEMVMMMLKNVLEMRMIAAIRGERGAAYTVTVEASLQRMPIAQRSLIVSFQSKPELMDELRPIVESELRRLLSGGVSPDEMAKVREYMTKSLTQSRLDDRFLEGQLREYLQYGDLVPDPVALMQSITDADLLTSLGDLLASGNVLTVIMRSAE